MNAPMNPVAVEDAIRTCASRIASSVTVCGKAYNEFLAADRHYDREYARAYLAAEGPAHERKFRAELETSRAREERDVKDAAYRYAERTSKAVEAELRAWQSVGASVRSMFGVAGRGEGS